MSGSNTMRTEAGRTVDRRDGLPKLLFPFFLFLLLTLTPLTSTCSLMAMTRHWRPPMNLVSTRSAASGFTCTTTSAVSM